MNTIGDPNSKPKTGMLSDRFRDALVFSFNAHRNQLRKSTTIPYYSHLMGVASLVLEDGGNEDEAIAALLHDAVEDQGGNAMLREIRDRFGENVAQIVEACSDSFSFIKPAWRERKMRYLEHIKFASESAQRVSMADKLHNLRDILTTYRKVGEKTWQRFKGGKEGTLWYYGSLIEIFETTGSSEMTRELRRVYNELILLMEMSNQSSNR